MWTAVVLGLVACALCSALIMPVSRLLVLKLQTLSDVARRAQPELYAEQLAGVDPFDGPQFEHKRIARMLRADVSRFGPICERLQLEARKLDRRAHIGMLPLLVYALGLALWAVL